MTAPLKAVGTSPAKEMLTALARIEQTKSIDELYAMLAPEQQHAMIFNLNAGKEYTFSFPDDSFIGVHVYSTNLKVTDRQNNWSKGFKQ